MRKVRDRILCFVFGWLPSVHFLVSECLFLRAWILVTPWRQHQRQTYVYTLAHTPRSSSFPKIVPHGEYCGRGTHWNIYALVCLCVKLIEILLSPKSSLISGCANRRNQPTVYCLLLFCWLSLSGLIKRIPLIWLISSGSLSTYHHHFDKILSCCTGVYLPPKSSTSYKVTFNQKHTIEIYQVKPSWLIVATCSIFFFVTKFWVSKQGIHTLFQFKLYIFNPIFYFLVFRFKTITLRISGIN